MALSCLVALSGHAANAQDYPRKPIRIVTGGVGGSVDVTTRVIAQGITGAFGQQIIVDNRASGVIPGDIVARAPADGYTLLLSTGIVWLLPLLQDRVPYDPVKDFSPLTLAALSPNVLVVTQSLPAKTGKELIALAKAKPKPGVLNYASTGDGGGAHLAAELFRAMADVNIERIPYKGGGDALNAVIGGQVHIMFATAASGMPHVKSGRLNVLAVTTTQPSALVPGVPTVAASGLPGYESAAVFAMFAPATTPAALRDLIHKKIVDTLARADMKERLFKVGLEPVGSSPDELTAFMKINISRLGKVIRDAGIRAD